MVAVSYVVSLLISVSMNAPVLSPGEEPPPFRLLRQMAFPWASFGGGPSIWFLSFGLNVAIVFFVGQFIGRKAASGLANKSLQPTRSGSDRV